MSDLRLALFDCDGTLANSHAFINSALLKGFADCGFPVPNDKATQRIIGLSFREALQALDASLTGEQLAAVEARCHVHLLAARTTDDIVEPLYEGIAPMLEQLSTAGWLMGVATGKGMHGLKHLLDTNGVARHFVTLNTSDECISKPAPEMVMNALAATGVAASRCIVIGDTTYDMKMAHNAGVKALGVAWGYHPPAQLLEAGALAVVPTPAELPHYLEDLL